MTEEDRKLLLKDLSSRLPYGVKGALCDDDTCTLDRMWTKKGYESVVIAGDYYDIEDFKPYLLPLSSMTEEQEEEYNNLNCYELGCFPHTEEALDYLIENHFDYRYLIDKGLAIDATNLNIY